MIWLVARFIDNEKMGNASDCICASVFCWCLGKKLVPNNINVNARCCNILYKKTEDGYLELKVKRNIDISLPLKELKPFYANDEKWSPQSFLQDNYEVNFPEWLHCNTFIRPWSVKSSRELQEYFESKAKTKLSYDVENNCNIDENQIDGQVFEGKYFLEIIKIPMIDSREEYKFTFTRSFFFSKWRGGAPMKSHLKIQKKAE